MGLPFHEDYMEELASKQSKIPRRLLDLMYVYSVDHCVPALEMVERTRLTCVDSIFAFVLVNTLPLLGEAAPQHSY